MSLMGTLAKVAIGVAVAKGVGSMMQKSGANSTGGGPFGGSHSPGGKGTGIEDMMGEILGGRSTRAPGGSARSGTGGGGGILGGSGGGLGDFLEELGPYAGGAESGADAPRGTKGGLDDLIGSLGPERFAGRRARRSARRASRRPGGRLRRCCDGRPGRQLRRYPQPVARQSGRARHSAHARAGCRGGADAARDDPGGEIRRQDRRGGARKTPRQSR